jgi:hypothetical protein
MGLSKRILITSCLIASALAWGQDAQVNESSSAFVRVSFTSFILGDSRSYRKICFSFDRTGHYELERVTMKVSTKRSQGSPVYNSSVSGPSHTELVQGSMFAGDLQKLEKLLADSDFMKVTASTPEMTALQKGSEDFVAEVPRENGVQRVAMRDADGENPFPRSVQEIVNWLQHFKAENAKPLNVLGGICPKDAWSGHMLNSVQGHTR